MLSGSIVRVWGALESVLVRSESILSKSDRTMRIVRVNTGETTSLIGAQLLHIHSCFLTSPSMGFASIGRLMACRLNSCCLVGRA